MSVTAACTNGGAIDTSGMLSLEEWNTPVYGKPLVDQVEQERLDFGRSNHLSADGRAAVVNAALVQLPELDGIIINQQLRHGVMTDGLVSGLNRLAAQSWRKMVCGELAGSHSAVCGMLAWMNAREAVRACRGQERSEAGDKQAASAAGRHRDHTGFAPISDCAATLADNSRPEL